MSAHGPAGVCADVQLIYLHEPRCRPSIAFARQPRPRKRALPDSRSRPNLAAHQSGDNSQPGGSASTLPTGGSAIAVRPTQSTPATDSIPRIENLTDIRVLRTSIWSYRIRTGRYCSAAHCTDCFFIADLFINFSNFFFYERAYLPLIFYFTYFE